MISRPPWMLWIVLLAITASASAVTYSVTLRKDEFSNPPGGAFTLTFTNVPVPVAGGTLKVRASGDLDSTTGNEYLDVSMEGIVFGPLFNRNPADDRFNNDVINDAAPIHYSPSSSTANVTLAELQNVTANGSVAVTIAPSASVNDDGAGEFVEVTLAYEAVGTGACCITAGETCQDLNATGCATQSGTYAGDGTSCATYVCFPKGACCLPNGTCSGDLVTPTACAGLNGVFQGNGSTCAGSDCRIKGSCCVAGACTLQTSGDCSGLGGAYGGDHSTCGGDTDADGIPDACDLCPATVPGIAVDSNGCPPLVRGDFDHDGDVDSADFDAFTACDSRAKVPPPPGCSAKDLDNDGDADLTDFGLFQRCFSGENLPADPTCDD